MSLLQTQRLNEKKNQTLKCTTRLCDQWKVLQCWLRTGICPLFPSPSRGIWQLKCPPGICHPTYTTYNYCKNSDLCTLPKSLFRWQNVSCTIFALTLTYTAENINFSLLCVYVGSYSCFQGIPVTLIKQLPLRGDVGRNKRKSSLCIVTKIRVGYQMSSG